MKMQVKEIIERLKEFDKNLFVAIIRYSHDEPVVETDIDFLFESIKNWEPWEISEEIGDKSFVLLW